MAQTEEERLYAAVFGDEDFAARLQHSESEDDEPVTERGDEYGGLADADLFVVDDELEVVDDEDTSDQEQQDETQTSQDAWHDSDDDRIQVSLTAAPKLKKLRRTDEEDVVSGIEYARRLRAQFEKVYPVPDWALPSQVRRRRNSSDSDSDGEGQEVTPLAELLKSATGFTTTSKTIRKPGTIDIRRLRDANHKARSQAAVQALQFHPQLSLLMTGGYDKTLRLFHTGGKVNAPATALHLPNVPIQSAAFHPDGHRVFVGGKRKFFHIWDLETGKLDRVAAMYGHETEHVTMEHFSLSPDGEHVALRGARGWVGILAAQTGQWIGGVKSGSTVVDMCWRGTTLSILDSGANVTEYDAAAREVTHKWHDDGGVDPRRIVQSARHTAIGSGSGVVNIYDGKRKLVKALDQITTGIHAIAFSPDGQVLAMSSRAKRDSLRLVHMPSCTVFQNWPTQQTPLGRVNAIAWSPRSDMLCIGNEAGRATLWQLPLK